MEAIDILITIHATSTWNELSRTQGHCDPELSEAGRRMSMLLANRPDLSDIQCIYTSDLRRAYETATPLSERLGVPIIQSAQLREGNWANYHRDPECPPLPFDGPFEDVEALTERAIKTTSRIAGDEPRSPILIVSHGGFVRRFLLATFPDRISEYKGIRTAINRVRYADGVWSLLFLNEDAHLEKSFRGGATMESG